MVPYLNTALQEYRACHVTYQFKMSSANLTLGGQTQSLRLNLNLKGQVSNMVPCKVSTAELAEIFIGYFKNLREILIH